jgi:hypothetical protein
MLFESHSPGHYHTARDSNQAAKVLVGKVKDIEKDKHNYIYVGASEIKVIARMTEILFMCVCVCCQ